MDSVHALILVVHRVESVSLLIFSASYQLACRGVPWRGAAPPGCVRMACVLSGPTPGTPRHSPGVATPIFRLPSGPTGCRVHACLSAVRPSLPIWTTASLLLSFRKLRLGNSEAPRKDVESIGAVLSRDERTITYSE